MRKYFTLLVISLAITSLPFASFAVEEEEELEYSYGNVISIDTAQREISVSEFDWEAEEDITVTYSVASDAVFEGVASLDNISAKDEISINYVVKNNKKIAKVIEVYKTEIEYEDIMP